MTLVAGLILPCLIICKINKNPASSLSIRLFPFQLFAVHHFRKNKISTFQKKSNRIVFDLIGKSIGS
jgi:hypothetical protein